MSKVISTWKWSLGVVTRSLGTVILLAALAGAWCIGAYELLGLPAESSLLFMVIGLVWALAQLWLAALLAGGTLAGAGATAAGLDHRVRFQNVWKLGRKRILATIAFAIASFIIAWGVSNAFGWINDHSLEVASFLTFHLQKPVSHEALEVNLFDVVESVVWIMLSGFLLSYFMVLIHSGWRTARAQSGNLLKGCVYRAPFATGVLAALVFGGLAHLLAGWHPLVTPGTSDYAQVVARFAVVLFLMTAGVLFWTLSLARLFLAPTEPPAK
jgi:hypothetical protein